MAKKMMSLKLEQETFDRLKMAAVIDGTSMTQIIEELIQKYLNENSKEKLMDRFFKLPAEERLNTLHRIQEQERERGSESNML